MLTDKERIMLNILNRLYRTQTLAYSTKIPKESDFKDCLSEYVHFGCYEDRPVQEGDLVLCSTGRIDKFKLSFVHQVLSSSRCILREIGTDNLCDYSNERFVRIVGLTDDEILDGEKYKFQIKVWKAFNRGDEYWYRYGGLEFEEGNIAKICIREPFANRNFPKKSLPFYVKIKWNKRTTIKSILEKMREAGYGTREFEVVEETNKDDNRIN